MTNDLRKMTDEQLLEHLRLQISILYQACDDEERVKEAAVSRWSEIDKEFASRIKAMRELCEAVVGEPPWRQAKEELRAEEGGSLGRGDEGN